MPEAGNDQNKLDEIGAAIISLHEERQNLLTEAANRKEVKDRVESLSNLLDEQIEAVTEYSDALVRRLIEKITIFDEKALIEFKSGLKTGVDE